MIRVQMRQQSSDFRDFSNFYYLADRLADFDPATHAGSLTYQRAQYSVRHAFDNDLAIITPAKPNEFPDNEYAASPTMPFSIDFVSPHTLRIRMTSGPQVHPPQPELMLAGPVPHDDSWKYEKVDGGWRYASAAGSVTILEDPFHIEIRDASVKAVDANRTTPTTTKFLYANPAVFLCAPLGGLLAQFRRRLHVVTGRETFRLRRILHRPRQARHRCWCRVMDR